ncbi:hypothetical protein [Tessaracoccus terricola]
MPISEKNVPAMCTVSLPAPASASRDLDWSIQGHAVRDGVGRAVGAPRLLVSEQPRLSAKDGCIELERFGSLSWEL